MLKTSNLSFVSSISVGENFSVNYSSQFGAKTPDLGLIMKYPGSICPVYADVNLH